MRFYALLALINVTCFLPLYLLNARAAPNPLAFLRVADRGRRAWFAHVLYARYASTDPFRVHFDFTLFVLVAVAIGATGSWVQRVAAGLLAFGFVEIQYTAVMQSIFKRPPALVSDWSLLRSGFKLAQRQAYWMVPAVLGLLLLVWFGAVEAATALLGHPPQSRALALLAALVLLPPFLFHCLSFAYSEHHWRAVYSPLLHLILNVRENAQLSRLYQREPAHYERHNYYRRVTLASAPNIVIVCVESYGSVVYREPGYGTGVQEVVRRYEPDLLRCGYRVASTFSDAPLFAGGSWLSYASFAYGAPIDNNQLYDALFTRPSGFAAYESLFHLLRRNGYDNVLLCPLGGVDTHSVDWESLDRCFQSQRRIEFEELGYVGPRVNYLGAIRRYSPLDQFSLNFGYEQARDKSQRFSLFFCTLNSHYPWRSVTEAADDWRALNVRGPVLAEDTHGTAVDRYGAAIRYQLDYLLRFACARAADAPLIILFGDHQPPMITAERMGKQTPFHVLSRSPRLIDAFLEHGFAGSMDLTGIEPRAIRHEGFLSLLVRGLHEAYGEACPLDLPYRERGAPLFDKAVSGRAGG